MSFNQSTIQRLALERFNKEQEAIKMALIKEEREREALIARRLEEERLARIRVEQEREEARIRAERALAEEKIRLEAAALEAAVQEEVERLRNRSQIEILQDEIAELKKEIITLKGPKIIANMNLLNTNPVYKSLSFNANNGVIGYDPHYGETKHLRITFVVKHKNGQEIQNTISFKERDDVHLGGLDLTIVNAHWGTSNSSYNCTDKLTSLIN